MPTEIILIQKIVWMQIVMAIVGIIIHLASYAMGKQTEKATGRKAFGFLMFLALCIGYYVWVVTYWLDLYNDTLSS